MTDRKLSFIVKNIFRKHAFQCIIITKNCLQTISEMQLLFISFSINISLNFAAHQNIQITHSKVQTEVGILHETLLYCTYKNMKN